MGSNAEMLLRKTENNSQQVNENYASFQPKSPSKWKWDLLSLVHWAFIYSRHPEFMASETISLFDWVTCDHVIIPYYQWSRYFWLEGGTNSLDFQWKTCNQRNWNKYTPYVKWTQPTKKCRKRLPQKLHCSFRYLIWRGIDIWPHQTSSLSSALGEFNSTTSNFLVQSPSEGAFASPQIVEG